MFGTQLATDHRLNHAGPFTDAYIRQYSLSRTYANMPKDINSLLRDDADMLRWTVRIGSDKAIIYTNDGYCDSDL